MLNKNNYEKRLLNEFRFFVVAKGSKELTNISLQKAMTLNENLHKEGYTLTALDVVKIASSDELDSLYEKFIGLLDEVKANPMYPDFPSQVMEMDEAQYRFHQLLHYMSTYGVELYSSEEVMKGWLPEDNSVEKVKEDKSLLSYKCIEVISEEEKYSKPLVMILSRKQRLSIPEQEIIAEALENLDEEILVSLLSETTIPFKENLMSVVYQMVTRLPKEKAIKCIHEVCQHTGDVLRCVDYALTRSHYHFSHATKRVFVRVLESYPAVDFRANLMLSNKKASRTLVLLRYLDYNQYSKSKEHAKAVLDLRQNRLASWEGTAKEMLAKQDKDVLQYIAGRPGMMLRWLNWLTKLGYSTEEILGALKEKVEQLSIPTLTSLVQQFSFREQTGLYDTVKQLLENRLKYVETPWKDKEQKVYIEEGMFDLEHSLISKSEEGGYIRSGLAFKIPEDVKTMRFFVYWNDKTRVDVDLHGYFFEKEENGTWRENHVGWNGKFKKKGIVMSGDITHSDAAEYIDIELDGAERIVNAKINAFNRSAFKQIEECYVGMMAVNKIGQDIKLYNRKNVFFSHDLKGNYDTVDYGFIDTANRLLYVFVKKGAYNYNAYDCEINPTFMNFRIERQANRGLLIEQNKFSAKLYLEMLAKAQGMQIVDSREEADVVWKMEKAESEKEVSVLDNNWWMD